MKSVKLRTKKLTTVLNKNMGFKIIFNILYVLNGQEGKTNDIPDDLTANNLSFF